jgi:hypothetical protein
VSDIGKDTNAFRPAGNKLPGPGSWPYQPDARVLMLRVLRIPFAFRLLAHCEGLRALKRIIPRTMSEDVLAAIGRHEEAGAGGTH